MNKKIDVGVLPDGFLIEIPIRTISGGYEWSIRRMNSLARTYAGFCDYRPAMDIWHFNDGKMVLPDGLVVESFESDGVIKRSRSQDLRSLHHRYYPSMSQDDPRLLAAETILGVKILGVTAEYGAQLGMIEITL